MLTIYSPESYKNSIKPLTEIRLIPNESFKVILSYGFNMATNSTGLGNSIEIGLVFLPKEKFCDPLDVFKKGGSSKSTRPSGRKSKFGRARLECPVYTKDKNIPTF